MGAGDELSGGRNSQSAMFCARYPTMSLATGFVAFLRNTHLMLSLKMKWRMMILFHNQSVVWRDLKLPDSCMDFVRSARYDHDFTVPDLVEIGMEARLLVILEAAFYKFTPRPSNICSSALPLPEWNAHQSDGWNHPDCLQFTR